MLGCKGAELQGLQHQLPRFHGMAVALQAAWDRAEGTGLGRVLLALRVGAAPAADCILGRLLQDKQLVSQAVEGRAPALQWWLWSQQAEASFGRLYTGSNTNR